MRTCFTLFMCCAALFVCAAHAQEAEAPCTARLEPTPVVRAESAAPLSNAGVSSAFSVRLRNVSDARCSFSLAFAGSERADALTADTGAQLDYVISRDSAGADVVFDSRRPDLWNPHQSFQSAFPLHVVIRTAVAPRAGRYTGSVNIALRDASAGELDRSVINIEAAVPAHVQAFLSGATLQTGGYALLDLDELTAGETASATLRVRATSDVDVGFQSDNRGTLVHEQNSAYRIEYRLRAGDSDIDLSAGSGVTSFPGAQIPPDIPLTILIGDVQRAPAGSYRDRIVVTVSAR